MELSHRVRGIAPGGDDGWQVWKRAYQMRASGIDITMLAVGDHDRLPPDVVLDTMVASARGGHTGYPAVPGIDALRTAVARRYQALTGVPTGPGNVLITPGGQAALFAALTGVADPGARIAHIDPYYTTYPGTIRSASCTPVSIPARPEFAFQPQAADLRAGLAVAGTRALMINTPNNPTGVVYAPQTMHDIADACREAGVWLISDEVYDSQVWQGQHLSARALPGMSGSVLVVGSMSKSHVMTGFRLGWLIGPEQAIDTIQHLSTCTTYGVPGFIQDAATAALAVGPGLEAEVAQTYRRRRDVALQALEGANGIGIVAPQGGMYVMLDIRATGLSGNDFAMLLLERHHIAVMPGESYGVAAAGHLRVALTVQDSRLVQALDHIRALVEGLIAARAAGPGA